MNAFTQPVRPAIPVNEALVLITICDDDVRQARIEASHNYRRAQTGGEAAFWLGVLQALIPSARPQA
jgi:hypothetical protein